MLFTVISVFSLSFLIDRFRHDITEAVGKSSLISTFVSRYFSEVVPGIMTRVRLPPDPELDCVTVICDSQNGDAALVQAMRRRRQETSTDSFAALVEHAEEQIMQPQTASSPDRSNVAVVGDSQLEAHQEEAPLDFGGLEEVDSIILVYDLDRVETFFRLEQHWLPLIERCFRGKVSQKYQQTTQFLTFRV